MKKVISLLLAIVFIFALPQPAAVNAGTSSKKTFKIDFDGKTLTNKESYIFFNDMGNAYINNGSIINLGFTASVANLSDGRSYFKYTRDNKELGFNYLDGKLIGRSGYELLGAFPIAADDTRWLPLSTICGAMGWYHSWDGEKNIYKIDTTVSSSPNSYHFLYGEDTGGMDIPMYMGGSEAYRTDTGIYIFPVGPFVRQLGGSVTISGNKIQTNVKNSYIMNFTNGSKTATNQYGKEYQMATDCILHDGEVYLTPAYAAGCTGAAFVLDEDSGNTWRFIVDQFAAPTPPPTQRPRVVAASTPTPRPSTTTPTPRPNTTTPTPRPSTPTPRPQVTPTPVSRGETCRQCNGTGEYKCRQCNGVGSYYGIRCMRCLGDGIAVCESCEGDGLWWVDAEGPTCSTCNGSGQCRQCNGTGTYIQTTWDGSRINFTCDYCAGDKVCSVCGGDGIMN